MPRVLPYQSSHEFARNLPGASRGARGFFRQLGMTAAQIVAVLGILAVFSIGFLNKREQVAGIVGPLVAVVGILCIASMMRSVRRRRAARILEYIEQATRLNLPLPKMMRAAQEAESGVVAYRLYRLRETLEIGAPVGVALDINVPEMPARVVALAASAERIGRLPQVLSRLVEQDRRHRREDKGDRMFQTAYPLIIGSFIIVTLTFVMVFVMPKFEQIFKDFGVTLPGPTRFLVRLARDPVTGPIAVVIPWMLALVLLVYLARQYARIFHPDRLLARHRWTDGLLWLTPFVHQMTRDQGLADVCGVTADALRLGYPLEAALLEAEQLEVNSVLRVRISRWRSGVVAGLPAAEAARRALLPPLLVGMLATGQASGSAAEAFEFLASYYQGRYSRGAEMLRGALMPLMAIFFGVLVGLVALALFTPMVDLVRSLNMNWGRL